MKQLLAVARKELQIYFGSPMASVFIGAFLLAALFSFFWVETFFARNLADLRPLFRWMPVLLIFLVASLTMRQWSEEQRMGTLEVLLTLPVKLSRLVLGKFLAVLVLVAAALALTAGLPLTVALLGPLDWGPVLGGYAGALLVASAYIAMGLFVSSRTDNQIVALILTVLLAGLFYLAGSGYITGLLGNETGELFRALGTGSRFAGIERGVLDLRDVVYYFSLAALFLAFNTFSLERKRWSRGMDTRPYRHRKWAATVLIGANLLAVNVWLYGLHGLRADLTDSGRYSLSPATRELLAGLREPLVLKGYFSERTHPLLAPLIPTIKDLMAEYEVAGHGLVRVSAADPKKDEEAEAEANQLYGIKPVPFQIAGRYEASVVNSYFHILVKYGDQYSTLGFDDLVEIEPRPDGQLEVGLGNLEYELTRAIKKAVYGFQSLASVFAGLQQEMKLTLVVTPATLPEEFAELDEQIAKVAADLQQESDGKLGFEVLDPEDNATRQEISHRFDIQPYAASLLGGETFYLHLFLTVGETTEQLFLNGGMGAAEIRQEIEGAIKRASSGFLKTVGLWTPGPGPAMGMLPPPVSQYRVLRDVLRESANVTEVDLANGQVAGGIDVLLLVAPQELTELERLAVDQYLMRGGSLVVLAGRYLLDLLPGAQTLELKKAAEGLGALLEHYGVTLEEALVMDPQNEPFPIPVTRDLGGIQIQEIQQIDYPFFVDVRGDGMNDRNPITANLPAVTLNWVSPLLVDRKALEGRTVSTLLESSPGSWLYTGTDVQPDFERYPRIGFPAQEPFARRTLAVAVQGSFTSFFRDRDDPRLAVPAEEEPAGGPEAVTPKTPPLPLIDASPASSRLVVVGSAEFLNDTVIGIAQSVGQDRFLNSLQFLQNAIDWSVEDEELLTIRSRGSHVRLLKPMGEEEQVFWEGLNYGIALAGLLAVSWFGIRRRQRQQPMRLQ